MLITGVNMIEVCLKPYSKNKLDKAGFFNVESKSTR